MPVCEACARGKHESCCLGDCSCTDERDGDELAAIADTYYPPVDEVAAFHEEIDQGVERLRQRTAAMIGNLNPTERSILERRFPNGELRKITGD